MFLIKICDVVIEIKNKYDDVKSACADYITEGEKAAFSAEVTEDEILARHDIPENFGMGYAEKIILYQKICDMLIDYDCFFMHGCVISADGHGYIFTAPSGTGKSTHARLWIEYFGSERVFVVNGDKPVIKKCGSEFFAYGTPWCGKEGLQKNTRVKLEKVCFLERCEKNSIEKMKPSDITRRVFDQIERPRSREKMQKLLGLLDEFYNSVQTYRLLCDVSFEAVKTAYNELVK